MPKARGYIQVGYGSQDDDADIEVAYGMFDNPAMIFTLILMGIGFVLVLTNFILECLVVKYFMSANVGYGWAGHAGIVIILLSVPVPIVYLGIRGGAQAVAAFMMPYGSSSSIMLATSGHTPLPPSLLFSVFQYLPMSVIKSYALFWLWAREEPVGLVTASLVLSVFLLSASVTSLWDSLRNPPPMMVKNPCSKMGRSEDDWGPAEGDGGEMDGAWEVPVWSVAFFLMTSAGLQSKITLYGLAIYCIPTTIGPVILIFVLVLARLYPAWYKSEEETTALMGVVAFGYMSDYLYINAPRYLRISLLISTVELVLLGCLCFFVHDEGIAPPALHTAVSVFGLWVVEKLFVLGPFSSKWQKEDTWDL
uniref:Uncharacterized protein n=1 Tax=Fibrocapsa japonica TaxID=94617 RepID=A0A7S2UUG5_9STRA|mmetsp:Transcript_13967/g.20594  ORF Transcript_13967/g.20594 Transcript_13967/m.20594 type:complete len:364 (+) Transcript_13967:37-1128(+)